MGWGGMGLMGGGGCVPGEGGSAQPSPYNHGSKVDQIWPDGWGERTMVISAFQKRLAVSCANGGEQGLRGSPSVSVKGCRARSASSARGQTAEAGLDLRSG